MSILDKKYYLRANISTSKIEGKTINFYNTDKNTSVLYLKLKYIDSCNLEKYFTSQMLDEYTIKLTVVKPKTLALVELNGVKENDMFKFELPSDFTDQVGKCVCEIMLSNATEDLTLEEFTYNVKESATTKFNAEIEKNPDLPILKQLIKEIKIINSNEDIRKENEINRVDEEKKRVIEHQSREQFLNSFEPKLQQMETDFNEAVANVTNGNESTTNSEVVLARKGKVSLREKIDEFDAQFNTVAKEKADKSEVRLTTDLRPINYTEFDNETKQKLTGGAVAVVGKNSVGYEELKDNSIIDANVQNISLMKITDVENGGLPFIETKKMLNRIVFNNVKVAELNFVADSDCVLELISDTNISNNEIRQSIVTINGNIVNTAKLFPGEIVTNNNKDVCFEKKSIKDFMFDSVIENNGTWARVACSSAVSDLYKKDMTGYNAITDNSKFISKPQTEFSSYQGNLIGLHSNGTLQIKVSKSEVESSGRVFDTSGILNYINNLADFNIYLKYATKKTIPFNISIPLKKNDVVSINNGKFNLLYNDVTQSLISTYKALVKNNNKFDVTNRVIKINCDFDYGVVKDKKCIKVKNNLGNYIDCQVIDNEPTRYGKESTSTHKDGSIKNCSIILLDSFLSEEIKEYIIEVYSNKFETVDSFNVNDTGTTYEIENNNIRLQFHKSKNSILTNIFKNGTLINPQTQSIPFRFIHKVLTVGNELADIGTLKEFKITNGTIMCSINAKIEFNNILHDITYEFYKNGEIRCVNYNIALSDVSNCYGILLRSNTEYATTPIYSSKNPTSYYESNGVSTRVVYSNGDVPRDEGYGYPLIPSKALGMRIGETSCYSCICGWEFGDSDTKYEIPKDFVFSNCIVINTSSNEKDNAYELNPITGEIIKDNIVNNKHLIKSNIVRLIKSINPQMEKVSPNDTAPAKFLPSLYARLILSKESDLYTLDSISNIFKSLMVKDYVADSVTKLVNATNLKILYDGGSSPLHYSSRVFPICKFLLKEYRKIGDTDEINYYTTTIKEYAEFVCRVFEEKGNTPLYGDRSSLNSNSTASGCKALSDGLDLEENTRWRNALDGNVEVLKNYKVENILKEGDNISSEQYLHYHTFASHDYFACSSLDSYIIHPSQYVSMCLTSKGELMDEIWCCSRSRRGLTSTIGYAVFLLVKDNTPQSVELANKILNSLWENFDYNGTQNFPLYDFDLLPPQTYETSTPMQLQALCEVYYMLEEMGI